MKLLGLSLKFFRQHEGSNIKFSDGLTGIVGPNGAGKTTLVEAIAFALYGSKAVRGKLEELRTKGLDRAQRVRAGLDFEHDGYIFRVIRTTLDAELYQGGEAEPLVRGTREVTQKITELLRMNYEEFVATYYTEQKGLEFLSAQKGAAERERFILRMMGYDRFEVVQELLRNDRRDKKNELVGREASLGNREDIEARLRAEKEELLALLRKYEEAGRVLEQAEKEAEKLSWEFRTKEEKRSLWLTQRSNMGGIQGRHGEKIFRAKQLEKDILNAREEIKKREQGFTDAHIITSEDVEQKQTQKEELRNKLQEKVTSRKEVIARLEIEKESLNKNKLQLQKQLASWDRIGKEVQCPTCGQELGTSYKQVRLNFTDQLKVVEERGLELDAQLQKLRKPDKDEEELTKLLTNIEAQLQELKLLEQKIRFLNEEKNSLTRKESDLAQVQEELNLSQKDLEQAQSALEAINFSEEEYLRAKGALEAAKGFGQVARLQKLRLEGEVGVKKAMVGRTEHELDHFYEKREKIELGKKHLLILEKGDELLTDFRRYVVSSIRPRLSELASDFMAELSDGRYTSVELAPDFSPIVIEDGAPKTVVSGGEEDILNLSMRLALSQMLAERAGQTFSLLILDEVFGSLDEQRRINLLSLLEKLRNRFEQIFVITHCDDIKEGVGNLLYVDYDEASGRVTIYSEEKEEKELLVMNM